ncbi:MAG: pyridoxamine 5'-phosphate oxidase family protein [Chloroflexota bacterium]
MADETRPELTPMPAEQLEKHLTQFINAHNVCVLATARDNIPRATPLEYEAEGTTLYIMAGPGQKLENLKANPLVGAAIHDPLKGWQTVKGIQITGRASLITDQSSEYQGAWKVFNRANADKDGWDVPPPGRTLLKIEADKIELMETSLKKKGFKIRQTWGKA